MDWTIQALIWGNYIVFAYFLLVQSFYLMLMILAIPELYMRMKEVKIENFEQILSSESVPQITIIVPAYNESVNINFVIRCLLNLTYRYKEIIIVNDGSTDNMLDLIKNNFKLYPVAPVVPAKIPTQKVRNYYRSKDFPNLIIVDKENGGKVDSVNAGLNAATSDFYISVDADTIITEDALQALMRPFLMQFNIIGCGGTIGIANDCKMAGNRIEQIYFPHTIIAGIQVIEYMRAFLMGKLGWNHLGGHLIVSGAFGLFDINAVIESGGYKLEIGDDVDLTFRLNRQMREKKQKYRIDFIPDLVCLTQVPFKIRELCRQRERWQRGLLEVLWINKKMLFNPRYGKIGMIGVPYFTIIEAISPIIEIGGYFVALTSYFMAILNAYAALWLLLLALGFPLVLSFACILIESISLQRYFSFLNLLKMIGCAILEQVGYRQLLVFVRLYSFFKWIKMKIKGEKQSFRPVQRTGFYKEG